jgi:hypothetical protein
MTYRVKASRAGQVSGYQPTKAAMMYDQMPMGPPDLTQGMTFPEPGDWRMRASLDRMTPGVPAPTSGMNSRMYSAW